jgi:hypothetical protein
MTDQEILDHYSPKELLLLVLNGMDIKILEERSNLIITEKGYAIEIEGKSLYKLIHEGKVIAPYSDIIELCNFIRLE